MAGGLALVGLVAATAACGDDGANVDGGAGAATTTTTEPTEQSTTTSEAEAATSSTTTTALDEVEYDSVEDEITARYIGYWDARFEANSPPDPDHPELREYACCEQLDHVIDETQGHLDSELEFQRPDDPADMRWVEVVRRQGDEAVVQECVVVDTVVVNSDTGVVVADDVATYNVRGEMRRGDDGKWRLARASEVQRWEGVAGCIHAR